jgi:hypothetical protein
MAGESLDAVSRTFHTENGVAHPEGETYAITDPELAETVWAIGFVSIAGWTPEPPPEIRGRRDDDRRDDDRRDDPHRGPDDLR